MSDHEALGLPERQGAWVVAAYVQVNSIDTQSVGDFRYGLYKECPDALQAMGRNNVEVIDLRAGATN